MVAAAPTSYVPAYSFAAFQAVNPSSPPPGGAMDAEHYAIKASVASVILALADVRRGDGAVTNGSVRPESLHSSTTALLAGNLNPVGTWIVTTAYAKLDLVQAPTGGGTYLCALAHTSGVFLTDVAAGKWLCIAPFGIGQVANIPPALAGDVGKLPVVTAADTYAWSSAPFTPVGFRNKFINADFQVNQRAFVSGAALAAGVYGHDRWKAGAGGCTYSFTSVLPSNSLTITAGTLMQVIEGAHSEGGSFWLAWTGTAQARVNGGAYAASPMLTSGLTGGVDITVEFNTGSLANPQFETNGVSLFERRPPSTERLMCERYYRRVTVHLSGYSVSIGGSIAATLHWPAMRAVPTATVAAAGTAANVATTTLDALATHGARFILTATAAGALNTLDRTYALSAEL